MKCFVCPVCHREFEKDDSIVSVFCCRCCEGMQNLTWLIFYQKGLLILKQRCENEAAF